MNQKMLRVYIIAVSFLAISLPAFAHHGISGYDMAKTITLHGTVTKFDFINPHSVIYVDVKTDSGEVQNWALELTPPALLVRAGWSKTSLKAGDEVTIETHASKNGAPVGVTGTATFILKVVVNGQALPTR